MICRLSIFVVIVTPLFTSQALADVGDPQIRTDHPWYPGELAMSTFDRLFATQAEVYERVTGIRVDSDEQKALASWLWRNTHYWHGQAGRRDLWGEGLTGGKDLRLREYWNGLFGYGFGLCGTKVTQGRRRWCICVAANGCGVISNRALRTERRSFFGAQRQVAGPGVGFSEDVCHRRRVWSKDCLDDHDGQ